jgi:hypothetical protein
MGSDAVPLTRLTVIASEAFAFSGLNFGIQGYQMGKGEMPD